MQKIQILTILKVLAVFMKSESMPLIVYGCQQRPSCTYHVLRVFGAKHKEVLRRKMFVCFFPKMTDFCNFC